jgi:hypothetical protein
MMMFWFERQEYKDFHAALLAEISSLPASKMAGIKWENSSYNNDACGSIMFNYDNDSETYVQLFAFETKADAIQELGEEYGTQYSIKVSINGDSDWSDFWDGDDREEAMVQAIIAAEKMMSMDADKGFEHDGQWITDITKSPCGRFDYTVEESVKEYAHTIKNIVMGKTFEDLDGLCLFVQNSIGLRDGGNAAMFWSGRENGIQEILDEVKSNNVLDAIPEDYLLEYVQDEISYHVGDE